MKVKKSLIVARLEFSKTVRRKGFIISALFIPLFMFLVGYISTLSVDFNETEMKPIGFVGESSLIENSQQDFLRFENHELAREYMKNQSISAYFVLGEKFPQNKNLTLYYLGSSIIEEDAIRTKIESMIKRNLINNTNASQAQISIILEGASYETIKLDDNLEIIEDESSFAKFAIPYVIAILLVFSIMTSSGYLMEGIGEEKETKTGEMLISSITTKELLTGKILGYGVLGLLQVLIWIILAIIALVSFFGMQIFNQVINYLPQIFLGFIYFILAYLLFSVSVAAISSLSSSAKEAQQLSSFFTILAVSPLIFSQAIISSPDSMIAKILTYFPYTSATVILMRSSLVNITVLEFILTFVILILSIILVLVLSIKIFRMGMLLQGKRPNLKEIFNALKDKN